MSYVVNKDRCPECAKLGKDRNGDNLVYYSDGHCFCYSCGYRRGSGTKARIESKEQHEEELQVQELFLPYDCSTDYPTRALAWTAKYELTRTDLINHNVLWSEKDQRLYFPVFAEGLVAYQGRDFSLNTEEKRVKWWGKGDFKNVFNILGKGERLVLCEDVVSAIKLSKCGVMAMPLYGSFVGPQRFKRLYKLFGDKVEVLVWLDPDKRSEAVTEARRGVMVGLRCRTMFSELDPKEHSFNEIKEILK